MTIKMLIEGFLRGVMCLVSGFPLGIQNMNVLVVWLLFCILTLLPPDSCLKGLKGCEVELISK